MKTYVMTLSDGKVHLEPFPQNACLVELPEAVAKQALNLEPATLRKVFRPVDADTSITVKAFINDCCWHPPGGKAHTEVLYLFYTLWAVDKGVQVCLTRNQFTECFRKVTGASKALISINGVKKQGFKGVALK